MIFVPLPETEPLLAKIQGTLPEMKVLLHPCYDQRTLLNPEVPVTTGGPVTEGGPVTPGGSVTPGAPGVTGALLKNAFGVK